MQQEFVGGKREMTRDQWLMMLRKCRTLETLERIIEHRRYAEIEFQDTEAFNSAADHRLAELTVNQLFDKVPASVWALIQ